VANNFTIDQSSVITETKLADYGSIIDLNDISSFAKVKYQPNEQYIEYYDGFIPNRTLSLQIRSRTHDQYGIFEPDLIYQ
jgi:hypothetical protein